MINDGTRAHALIACLVGMAMTSSAIFADAVTLVDQKRETVAFVIVPPCGSPQSNVQQEQAVDFDPFVSDITAELVCDDAEAMTNVSQSSTISATIMPVTGALYNEAETNVSSALHSISRSVYEVTFDVTAPVAYRIEGTINVAGDALPEQMADASGRVRLRDTDGTWHINEFIKTTPGVSEYTLDLDIEGVLEPGRYIYLTQINGVIDAYASPKAIASANFYVVLTFQKHTPGDLNGDGVVDGADLLILLSAWGKCADPDDCPADLNNDGVVDGADLLILLGNWG